MEDPIEQIVPEKTIYRVFEASIIGKGVFALIDICAAVFLYLFGPSFAANMATIVAQGELLEDPDDRVAQFFLHLANYLSTGTTTFAMWYLLVHGLINAVFVAGLLMGKHWAYIFALGAMSTFVTYQTYRLIIGFSPWLFALTLFDIVVTYLIWHEYRYKYGKHTAHR